MRKLGSRIIPMQALLTRDLSSGGLSPFIRSAPTAPRPARINRPESLLSSALLRSRRWREASSSWGARMPLGASPSISGRKSGNMICQRCQESPATVHLTRIEQKKKIEFHLCEPCAHSHSGKPGSGLDLSTPETGSSPRENDEPSIKAATPFSKAPEAASSLADPAFSMPLTELSTPCPSCGMTLTTFRNTGRLGCPNDYEHFRGDLKNLIEKLHGASQHRGKLPRRIYQSLEKRRELEALKKELELVVATENYESAATLLERIRRIEHELEAKTDH